MGDPVSCGRVQTRALSGTGRAGKPGEGEIRWWGDVMRRRRSGVLVVFFSFVNGGKGPVTIQKKCFRSGKSVHVREVSPVPSRFLCGVSVGRRSVIRYCSKLKPYNHPTNHPTNQPTNQPTTQPTTQPTNQPTNQPLLHAHSPPDLPERRGGGWRDALPGCESQRETKGELLMRPLVSRSPTRSLPPLTALSMTSPRLRLRARHAAR